MELNPRMGGEGRRRGKEGMVKDGLQLLYFYNDDDDDDNNVGLLSR